MGKSNLDCGQFLLGTPSHFAKGGFDPSLGTMRQRRGPGPGRDSRIQVLAVMDETVEHQRKIIRNLEAIIKEKDLMIRKLQQEGLAAGLVRLGKMQIKNISFQMQCLMSV